MRLAVGTWKAVAACSRPRRRRVNDVFMFRIEPRVYDETMIAETVSWHTVSQWAAADEDHDADETITLDPLFSRMDAIYCLISRLVYCVATIIVALHTRTAMMTTSESSLSRWRQRDRDRHARHVCE